jgi:hypothetical protein
MKARDRHRVLWGAAALLVLLSAALNAAGYLFDLWRSVAPYDEIVHTVTPFTLVAIASAVIYRSRRDHVFLGSPRRAALTGMGIGLVGAVGWEIVEVLLDKVFGVGIYNPPLDTAVDVALGTGTGTVAALAVYWLLDR